MASSGQEGCEHIRRGALYLSALFPVSKHTGDYGCWGRDRESCSAKMKAIRCGETSTMVLSMTHFLADGLAPEQCTPALHLPERLEYLAKVQYTIK